MRSPEFSSFDFSGCAVGAYVNGMENLGSFQKSAGKKLAAVLWYVHWPEPFPAQDVKKVDENGSLPLITWEPWVSNPSGTLEAIASGIYENYLKDFIQAARDWGKPLFLRVAHEMNGNWYPWDGFHNGGDRSAAEKYKRAWLYIYNVRKKLGADNIYLVWCPNNTNQPDASWNRASFYFPGDEYVDWIGMDGYNWGYGMWQSFPAVFDGIYQELTALTNKPLMIGEFASAEARGKADWIKDTLYQIKTDYPRIKLFCWFNINKERDWRIDSSSSCLAAFKQSLQDDYFLDTITKGR